MEFALGFGVGTLFGVIGTAIVVGYILNWIGKTHREEMEREVKHDT